MSNPDPGESFPMLPEPLPQNIQAQPVLPEPRLVSCRRCSRTGHPVRPGMEAFLSIRVLSVPPGVFLRPEPAPIAADLHQLWLYIVILRPLLIAMPEPP